MKIAPYPLPKYPKSDKPKADGSDGARFPFADEGITTSIRDATLTGEAVSDQGLVRLLVEHPLRAAEHERDAEGDRQPRPAGRRRHDAERDRRLRRRRAAGGHVPRALRRAAGRLRPHRVDVAAPAGRRRAARAEAGLVDREAAREQARHRRVHAVQGHGGVPRLPDREVRLQLGGLQARRRDHGRRAADHRRGRPRAHVRHAVEEGRVLVRPAREGGLRPGAEIHGARRGAGRAFPAHHRARARAHVQPHADQSAAARPDVRERGVGERRDGREARVSSPATT